LEDQQLHLHILVRYDVDQDAHSVVILCIASTVMSEGTSLRYQPKQIAEAVDAVMWICSAISQRAAVASTTAATPVSAVTERKKRAKKSTISKVLHLSFGSMAPIRPSIPGCLRR
jgi:hypothetical protein